MLMTARTKAISVWTVVACQLVLLSIVLTRPAYSRPAFAVIIVLLSLVATCIWLWPAAAPLHPEDPKNVRG
jgi:hypothetical protein